MAKPRINVHITREVWKRLDEMAKRPGVSKAAIVDAALAAFLSPEADDRRDAAIIRRLDRIDRRIDRADRDITVTAETLALFARYFLTVTPPLPEQDRQAAQALGRERFGYFIEQLAKRLASGKSLSAEVLDDTVPEASQFADTMDFTTIGK
ncbi:ribbon-helix-helix protein, CopG family [Parasphingopyxis algicola]|uniref:ribbon-helix-helix protein, CopG family n=1 Tax=Parasphingopyxis algicola TaxID=2026624 RepID=UPI0015A099C0|nr:ribbon-helix-helix protein, CopG family [Parasphingopyxis algicola]QLC24872.1 ribbon-helix-helix protein, CopG family [Parasphingopyxis algicola]